MQGLVQIYTGDGKGKTTAAVGLAVRAAGAGLRVCFVQFVKGGEPSSELAALERLGVQVVRTATLPTGLLRGGPTPDDYAAAVEGLRYARERMAAGDVDLLILDELNIALRTKLISLEETLLAIRERKPHVEVVATGRGAPPELRDMADLVSEVQAVKHPYQKGIAARLGIEY
jgi:cob(I)alamin adenosyltransferase